MVIELMLTTVSGNAGLDTFRRGILRRRVGRRIERGTLRRANHQRSVSRALAN